MTTALEQEAIKQGAVPYEERAVVPASVFGTDSPIAIAERTTSIARVLGDAIKRGGMTTKIGDRDYVRIEGWSYLGAMLGISPQTVSTEPLRRDPESPVVGFSATVELVTKAGETVGAGTAICTRDEKRWGSADDYAIMSMAQTRAAGKAFRMAFGFVMTEAGYEATPAEEMVTETTERPQPAPTGRTDPRIVAVNAAMQEYGFTRKDMARVLGVERVTAKAILNYLEEHGNDIPAFMTEIGDGVSAALEAGEDLT